MNKSITKKARGIKISPQARDLILELLTLALALAITPVSFFFGTYPFGLAFCASSKKRAPFAFAGCALGIILFMGSSIPYLIALLALIALRIVGSAWLSDTGKRDFVLGRASRPSFLSSLFTEKVSVRVGISALCALGIGMARVISAAFSYYEIFVLIFFTVFVSIITYALCSLFEKSERQPMILGICALTFILVYAIRSFEIFGVNPSVAISYALVLYVSKYQSGTKSVALGALLGICHGITFAPVFAICGLVSAFLWGFSYYIAIIGALVMSLGYGVFSSGYTAIVGLLPELLFASLVMYPLTKFEILPRPFFFEGEAKKSGAVIVSDSRFSALTKNLDTLAASFSEISHMISDLSNKAKAPDRDFYTDACLEICEKHCYTCPKRSICWERDSITTRGNLARMGESAFSNKVVGKDSVDEKFLHRCPNIEAIIDEINTLKHETAENASKGDKLEISAQDYELISELIGELGKSIDTDMDRNNALCDRVSRECAKIGLVCEKIEVFGKRKKRIIATNIDTGASKCTVSELKSALEAQIGASLSEPVIEDVDGACVLTMNSEGAFELIGGTDTLAKASETANGDTLCSFITPDKRYYMLLCDGMGSGKDAALTSDICAKFMQKFLLCCSEKVLGLRMLNNFIRAKGLECSSSVDLLEIDLLSGDGAFIKSGAAPSFVKRGENVFRLHSRTAPIGIMKTLDAEEISFCLREGDVVIMLSDGIASDERDSKYIADFLADIDICDVGSEHNTSPVAFAKRETLSPTNPQKQIISTTEKPSESGALLFSSSTAQGLASPTPRRKISLEALPSSILSLAKARAGSDCDDMTVGVIQLRKKVI